MHSYLIAIDWLSVKLTTLAIPFLFLGSGVVQTLGVVVMLSTFAYNVIRIYKEVKKKKSDKD